MREMREAIAKSENIGGAEIVKHDGKENSETNTKTTDTTPRFNEREPNFGSDAVIQPGVPVEKELVEKSNRVGQKSNEKVKTTAPKPSIIELANNTDFSVATIAKEANRINRKDEGEVFISLH